MTLVEARKLSTKFSLEDFVGTYVLDRYERLTYQLVRPIDDAEYQVAGTRLVLDGIAYDFITDRSARFGLGLHMRLREIRLGSCAPIDALELRGRDDYFCVDGPFVVTIYNRWDVTEYEHIGKRGNPNEARTLDAQMIYATCDNLEGRVLFEIGDEIHANPWYVQYISRWHPEGVLPDYFTRRDPDEPEPVEIIGTAKRYEPSIHGNRRKQRR